MNSFQQQETELQHQLQRVCSRRGRELNPTKSAEIFNKLGLLYKTKSPDKVSLIQSAALLNAAIIRQPDNQRFQYDLHELCIHVLSCANAEQNLVNLVNVAKRVKTQVVEVRNNTRTKLKSIKKISGSIEDAKRNSKERFYIDEIKSLQLSISNSYKRIMAYISQKCIQIMGSPPCKYTLVGMGSLARDEITPYSDFEHIILLPNFNECVNSNETSNIKEYFRWYSALFHIIVINLQETIIPSVAISCLNDTLTPGGDWFWDSYTLQGISFDSLKPLASKVPLGRTQKTPNKPWTTELIKPVDDMVKYLDTDEDLKNGYKLADILTRTCYVEGDEMIYDEFCQKVALTLKQDQNNFSNTMKQVDEDFANFAMLKNFGAFLFSTNINIKRIIYRSITLFLSALGRLYNVDENSCFDIIDEFQRKHYVNDITAHKLSHAVAIACHIRLFRYTFKQRQDDTIDKEHETFGVKEKLKELTKAVNNCCLVKCLSTGYILQYVVKYNVGINELNDYFDKLNFTAQMTFFHSLYLHSKGVFFGEQHSTREINFTQYNVNGYIKLCMMHVSTGQYNKSLALSSKIKNLQFPADSGLKTVQNLILNDIVCLIHLRRYSKAMSEIDSLLKINLDSTRLSQCLLHKVMIKTTLGQHREALSALRDMIKCDVGSVNSVLNQTMNKLSVCVNLMGLGKIRQGVHEAKEGLILAASHNINGYVYRFTELLNKHRHSNAQHKLDLSYKTALNKMEETFSET